MAAAGAIMNGFRDAVEQYLALRQSLGFELRVQEGILRRFTNFAESEEAHYVTINLVLRWTETFGQVLPSTVARAVSVVRCFAAWHNGLDPRTQIPPPGLVLGRYQRRRPLLHSDEQIVQLLLSTEQLQSPRGLSGSTLSTLFGLIVVTGLRISEAVKLDRSDVDLSEGILTIRRTKFGKSRLVPVHPTTRAALERYAERRDSTLGKIETTAFFVSEQGRRITVDAARYHFARVSQRLGHRAPSQGLSGRLRVRIRQRHGCGPRLHDLRHRFAAYTLLNWYRAGVDVEREIPKLATYLGHCAVSHTYWYIEAVPELLQLAAGRIVARGREVTP
jgi:integrase/recombinase XerD